MTLLSGKVAIITGGASGIGYAAATRFAAHGARLVLVGQNQARLEKAVATLGPEVASYVVADVADADQVAGYVRHTVARHQRIDILFSNAGIEGSVATIDDYPIEVFDRVVAVNLRGVWLGLKHVMPVMAKTGGGSIVINSSIAGFKGFPQMSAYVASKHAVVGVMRSAALEGAAQGIRVNTIHPGQIDTRMMLDIETMFMPNDPAGARAFIAGTIPLKRYGTPDEVARIVLFLASDESRFCTGGVYPIDGGVSAGQAV
jgi:NAD(P)-dependent dehydrogenase (short-subunit alcohol dehydrogenase family)